jgi:hypothetical protein
LRGQAQAVRELEEAVGVLVKVMRMAIEAVIMTIETIRVL